MPRARSLLCFSRLLTLLSLLKDEATASHPLVAHMLVVMNAAWISAFALMAAVAAVGALCNELIRPNLGETFQLAFTDPGSA